MKRGRSNWADHTEKRDAFARKVATALMHHPGVIGASANGNIIIVRAGDDEYTVTVCMRRKANDDC